MKQEIIVLYAAAIFVFALAAPAGSIDFLRDQLNVDASRYPFGSPPSAFPEFKRSGRNATNEQSYVEMVPYNGKPPQTLVQLHFSNGQLDAVMVGAIGNKERNDKLVAEFANLSGMNSKKITGSEPYEYYDGQYKLTYRGECSAEENGAAIFELTKVEKIK